MAMKPRVLCLMQYLQQNSDEQHPVTTAEIRKELAAKGCPVSMYDGNEEEVTLRSRHKILDQVIDRFGEGIELKNVTQHTFDVTVPVCISGTFYAWVTQFVGEMTIIAPGNVKDAYAEYLQEAIDDVLG